MAREEQTHRSQPKRNACAFVELIVVIGIIAVLTAILLPTAACRADMLYVVNATGGSIEKFDTSGGGGSAYASGLGSDLVGIAADNLGNTYVGQNGNIYKFTNGVRSTFATFEGLSRGMAFDSSGNLLVADAGANSVRKISPGGSVSAFATTGLNNPLGLAIDSSGNVYVANLSGNTIEKFPPAGGTGSVFANFNDPRGLAVDSSGNIYVSSNSLIEEFTPAGVGSVFANSGLSTATGLAFDSTGNLYAVNHGNNSIEKFTPGGAGSLFANSGLSGPEFIAIVPEPSSLLLLMGVWMLLLLFRRPARSREIQ